MADEIDLANEQSERWLNQSLSALAAGTKKLAPKGSCYYCDHPFDDTLPDANQRLFCDLDCSQDYEREQRLKNRR